MCDKAQEKVQKTGFSNPELNPASTPQTTDPVGQEVQDPAAEREA